MANFQTIDSLDSISSGLPSPSLVSLVLSVPETDEVFVDEDVRFVSNKCGEFWSVVVFGIDVDLVDNGSSARLSI